MEAGTNRPLERHEEEEEDSRDIHRRNLKRKQREGVGGGNVDGSGRSVECERNVRRRRRERSALHADEMTSADSSRAAVNAQPAAAPMDIMAEPPSQIPETLCGDNQVTPGPKDMIAGDAIAVALASEKKARVALVPGGGGGNGRDPELEDRASDARHIQPPPVRQLHEDAVRKPAAAPNNIMALVPVGERTQFRHASLSTTEEDSAEEEDVDPNRPCRVIQFVTVTHRRQLMQALQCNAATEGGARQPLHLRWREEVGLATTTRPGSRDPVDDKKKRLHNSGSRSSSSDDDDEQDDDSTASDSTADYSTSSSSSTSNSHECDASSVESDLTTDPRLFAVSTPVAANVSAAGTTSETDVVAFPLDANEDEDDNDGNRIEPRGRHYRLNLPPEVAWKALIVLSILVILLDMMYSTVADVVIRVVNRPRRTKRAQRPPPRERQ